MRTFLFTYDNPKGRDYSRFKRHVGKLGKVQKTATRTAWIIMIPKTTKFSKLKKALERVLDPKIGSALLHSSKSNKLRRIDNRGNRPNTWVTESY